MNDTFGSSSSTTPATTPGGAQTTPRRARSAPGTSPAQPSPTDSTASSSGSGSSTDRVPPLPDSFEAFLEDIQVGLLRALREYNGLAPDADDVGAGGAAAIDGAGEGEADGGSSSSSAPAPAGNDARPAVTDGVDGGPRRLNWSMSYRFPVRPASPSARSRPPVLAS